MNNEYKLQDIYQFYMTDRVVNDEDIPIEAIMVDDDKQKLSSWFSRERDQRINHNYI